MNKKQMNDAINAKLGYELLPAWEQYTYSELRMIYKDIVIYDCVPYFDGNQCIITQCSYR